MAETLRILQLCLIALCILALVLAVLDVLWTRWRWRQQLRMSREEVKKELRDSDGDPQVKARFRMLRAARARRRMMSSLPRATVVIANPTHYAIALRYVAEEQAAPLVLAKGVDALALRIRERAEELGVPVIEDVSLARAMFAQAEVDKFIPVEFYRAVAQVIHALQRAHRLRQTS